jgi:hypothetical protein
MTHTTLLAALLLASLPLAPAGATSVFINELHYDNTGSDAAEGVEIAGPAGTSLAGWSLFFYNGADGSVYSTLALDGVLPDEQSGYGALYFAAAGTQNGPDGIALVDGNAVVVQLLSYEGSFTALEGPAAGLLTTDIGVFEDGSGAAGFSMQLVGTGRAYEDFLWSASEAASYGALNAGQSIAAVPAPGALPLLAGALTLLGWRRPCRPIRSRP